jgi:uncharacterized membrane protein
LIIHREYFDFHKDEDKDYYQQAREIIVNVAFSWIGPVFFVALGSKLLFDLDTFLSVLPKALMLFVSLFIGQVLFAALADRYTGNFDWPAS